MEENKNKKPGKKRLLLYYLLLAACILIIAAVTVTVVLAVTGKNDKITVAPPTLEDNSGDNNDMSGGNSGETENPPVQEPDVDVNTSSVFIFPVSNPNVSQEMDFWYNATLDRYHQHGGMDFSCAAGDEVFAAIDGTVVDVIANDILDGGYIRISHDNGIFTVYKFVEPVEGLVAGARVNRGDVIGTVMAATGVEGECGDHLHFEVYRNGTLTNPAEFLSAENK